jgi:hypothetical protein
MGAISEGESRAFPVAVSYRDFFCVVFLETSCSYLRCDEREASEEIPPK